MVLSLAKRETADQARGGDPTEDKDSLLCLDVDSHTQCWTAGPARPSLLTSYSDIIYPINMIIKSLFRFLFIQIRTYQLGCAAFNVLYYS